ncbi:PH domain-containing protein [Natronolimnobius sp. AArcel1]|uniref:PH domain-containing protein n=1 Tax=Natronolimnobius sp. AArcel1 TaxID=1679093 RepID=UPI0013EA5726|nr:PH domain-containing protein [Natronolimnobius sp. AArcel1]NGM67406.1 PH domain-containing protein [Natronolimnobius sp. AArcel1]
MIDDTSEGRGNPVDAGDLEWLVLESDEEIRVRTGPRIQTVYPWLAIALVGVAVVSIAVWIEVISLLGALWIPVFVAPAIWQYAQVTRTAFLVTTHRVAVRSGVFGRSVRVVGLERVQNTTRKQHALGRLAGYGTVTIETASGSILTFWNVEEPASVQASLESVTQSGNGDIEDPAAVPGSSAQWQAVLEEVRGWRRALEQTRSN